MEEQLFGGRNPGAPVPQVDPEKLKSFWEEYRNKPPLDIPLYLTSLPPPAILAVRRRAVMVLGFLLDENFMPAALLNHLAPWLAARITNGQPEDAVFRAAARVSMKPFGFTSGY